MSSTANFQMSTDIFPSIASDRSEGEVLVKVEGVSKKFCRSLKKSLWYGLQDITKELNPFFRSASANRRMQIGLPALRSDEFWAVRDVSFEVRRGECLALIGHNGAGKTTLLKMLNGLIKPDSGYIQMSGRVGALIALGAGFNPILTGRENIYVNASILGLSRQEIDRKIKSIIEFSEIGDFIDTPVQSYSSGMVVRLGFAIAATLEPDVLILDEILAVGDLNFQVKCLSRIAELRKKCAILFVSHAMSSVVRISTNALLLDEGKPVKTNGISDAIARYRKGGSLDSIRADESIIESESITLSSLSVDVLNQQRDKPTGDSGSHSVSLLLSFFLHCAQDVCCVFSITFRNTEGIAVAECPSSKIGISKLYSSKTYKVCLDVKDLPLADGRYWCSLYVLDIDFCRHYLVWKDFKEIVVQGESRFSSPVHLSGLWSVESEETKQND